jgi:hypothetical protein
MARSLSVLASTSLGDVADRRGLGFGLPPLGGQGSPLRLEVGKDGSCQELGIKRRAGVSSPPSRWPTANWSAVWVEPAAPTALSIRLLMAQAV